MEEEEDVAAVPAKSRLISQLSHQTAVQYKRDMDHIVWSSPTQPYEIP